MDITTWTEYATEYVTRHAAFNPAFSGNDLWKAGLQAPGDGNRRRLAHVLLGLEKDGQLRRVGRTDSIGGHGQPILMWTKTSRLI